MSCENKFRKGEKVLCYYGEMVYEAKCLESKQSQEQNLYLIHYIGWNKSWDEWVPESRVLKYTETNIELQGKTSSGCKKNFPKGKKPTEVRQKSDVVTTTSSTETAVAAKVKGLSISQSTSQYSSSDTSKKKGRTEAEKFTEKFHEVNVKIPEELKQWLVHDWDFITQQKRLVILPVRISVEQIIENFIKHKQNSNKISRKQLSELIEVTNGIKEYFNTMLATQLLYSIERPQYSKIIETYQDSPMSKIYGAIHLLRLFVKLGNVLAYTPFDEKSFQQIVLPNIQDFLWYLNENMVRIFCLKDYGTSLSK